MQIKLATVQLARNYMKRVAGELDASIASAVQDPQREFLLLQGVRFAFRVHQVINPLLFPYTIFPFTNHEYVMLLPFHFMDGFLNAEFPLIDQLRFAVCGRI